MRIKWIYKLLLIALACFISVSIIIYTLMMTMQLRVEEEKKMNHWAEVTRMLATSDYEGEILDLLLTTVQDNTTIPVIVTDSIGDIKQHRNLSADDSNLSDAQRLKILEEMKQSGYKIDIPLGNGEMQYVYYSDSRLLSQLSYVPIVIIALVVLFVLFAYVVLSRAYRDEQNKVWVGLARETAHQLGTPITALMGWRELLATTDFDRNEVAKGISDDIQRLSNIAERFSKIGSRTEFDSTDIVTTIYKTFDYLKTRVPKGVSLSIENRLDGTSVTTEHNGVLIGWVIENLCRNAMDAMEGKGELSIRILNDSGRLAIEVCDTGRGMTRRVVNQIFKAGFTTKKRGWGIGLSLAKRIVEQYHRGKIYVKWSEVGKGTIIRVTLGSIKK